MIDPVMQAGLTAARAPLVQVVDVNGRGGGEQDTRSDSVNLLHPCGSTGGCLLDTATPPPREPSLHDRRGVSNQSLTPLLLSTASAARCRRRPESNTNNSQRNRPHRAASDFLQHPVRKYSVAAMEEVHGVDVSWLHHPHKGMAALST